MADRYQKWTQGAVGGFLADRLGLPRPEPLRRHRPGMPLVEGPVVLGATANLIQVALGAAARAVGGEAFELDVTNPEAPQRLAHRLRQLDPVGVDVFVHNAGITRDKTLGRMERGHALLGA